MNCVMNRIQQGDFVLLPNMHDANCMYVYQYIENWLFCKEKWMYLGAACFACKQLVDKSRKFLQIINISNRIRFKTAQLEYCRYVSKVWTVMSMHGGAEQLVVSHPFPSALPVFCAAISVSLLRTTKYSLPPCIVLSLCLLLRPVKDWWLGFDPVTYMQPARASHCSSPVSNLKGRCETKCTSAAHCGKYLPSCAFQLRRERQQF